MDFPIRFADTQQVAPDTYVIRQVAGEGVAPVAVFVNSMVITGAEPVIVDTGPAITRDGWLDRAFEIVDPADVRWVYLSHDDSDHVGNLQEVIARTPNANVVMTWFMQERLMGDIEVPDDRLRWINDGESFVAGDRELRAVRPPVFDSPTARGLFDTKTGVYWAGDAFGAVITHEVDTMGDLDPDFLRGAFVQTQQLVSPWTEWVDQGRYDALVDRVRDLRPSVIASGHGPAVVGSQVHEAIALMRTLPGTVPEPLPGQADLDAMIAGLQAA